MSSYQIYVVRGGRREDYGCWLMSENDRWFDSLDEAIEAANTLAAMYPDVGWVICDPDDYVVYELEPVEAGRES
ncbi:MAG: hypothetical protein QXP51_05490 [Candidatus Hadarchaeales archaeon]